MEYQGKEYTVSHDGSVTAYPVDEDGFVLISGGEEATDSPAAVVELARMETITEHFTRFVVTEEKAGKWITQLCQTQHPISQNSFSTLAEGVGDTEIESIEKCLAEAVDIFTI